MANLNKPMGLRPISRSISGGCLQTVNRTKLAAYGTKIRPFDVVNRVTSGNIERSITPGTTLISGVSMNFGAASTLTEHQIIEDPFQLYKAQAGGSTGFTLAEMGLNANIALGSTDLVYSDDYVADDSEAVDAALSLKVHDRIADPDNSFGQYVKVIVSINQHRLAATVVGV